MSNPFEQEDGKYVVLSNQAGQHSLWPSFAEVPAGWVVAHGENSRQSCLDYVERNWTEMKPLTPAE
ncbi:MbtH family protein [Streptomyces mirabilis]|uniref:MbtH family protein n=1 Tax=Streptomyces guryensis TaxID=2886947 RepID=A0A9Q3VNM3_9ACTN|nr:MbtH family protein [Streptomyces guryensis]MCD9877248.1 MbtH family protein [Streptomyces guryensis]